jgi:hypothetical protein
MAQLQSTSITGSLIVTGGITGSLLGTASFALTASYALNAGDSVWTGSGGNIYYNGGNVGIGTTNPITKLSITSVWSNGTDSPFISSQVDAETLNKIGTYVESTTTAATAMTFYTHPANNASSEKMRITSTGNVLIGTTTDAGYKLDVNGTFRSNALWTNASAIAFWGSGTTAYGGLTWDTGYATVYATAGNALNLGSNGASPDVTINLSGNVGIGTTTPNAKLDVQQNVDGNGLIITANSSTGTSARNAIALGNNTGNIASIDLFGSNYNVGSTDDVANGLRILNSGAGGIAFRASNASGTIRNYIGNSEAMRVASTGNVLIGTSTDGGAKFQVYNGYARFDNIGTQLALGTQGVAGVYEFTVGTNDSFDISLAGVSSRMYINSTGNVGIGTQTPNAKLDVNGNTIITGSLTVTGGITGSITSASYATQALSASFALTASYALNAGDSVWTGSGGNIYYNGGNVGIGTTSPASKLQIGSVGSTGYLVNNGLAFGDGTRAGALNVGSSGTILYSSTNLIFSPDTTEAVRITSAGNVGIGTTSPSAKLQVKGSGTTSSTTALLVQNANTSASLAVLDDGNVGIGTTNPDYKLDVIGNARIGQNSNSNTAASLQITAGGSEYNSFIDFGFFGTFDASLWNIGRKGSDGSFYISNYGSGYEANGLTIATTGNVGIGTTTPVSRLQSNNVSTYDSATPSGAIVASNLSSGNAVLDIGVDSTSLGYIQSRNITSTTAYNLLLNPIGGNIGIGTTNPGAKLEVASPSSGTTMLVGRANGNSSIKALPSEGGYLALDSSGIATIINHYSSDNVWLATGGGNVLVGTVSSNGSKLQVKGSGATSATTALRVENSNASASMVVLDNGNVGIGTTSPVSRLEVVNASSPYQISLKSDTSTAWNMGVGNSGYYQEWFLLNNGTTEIFRINSGYTEITNILYASSNLGIGKIPNAKLDVSGSAIITGSLNVTGGITGSLLGTASYATQALSASYAPSSPAFPYTGSARITGSLNVIGATVITG